MSEQINTPKMRFPEFRDEWEMKIIKELFNVVSGSTPLRSNTSYYENGNIPWVKTTDLNNSLINNTSEKVTNIALDNLKLLPKDTVLIAMYGGFNQIGRTGILNIKATTNQAISALIKKDDYNSKFLQSYLNFNVKQWRRFAASSRKDPNITKKDIEKFKIPYTCREEQEKIGTFFSKLDRQIELEEEKLELLEQQKRGYMQKIFSQELRFKDENRADYPNWKKIAIKEVANLTAGKGKKNENKGKYIIMDMGTVTKNGTMLTHKSTPYESDLLNKGDLVMPKDDIGGGHIIGKTVFIPESHKYVLGDHVYRLEIKNCNSLFLHYYINSDIVNHSLKRKVTGSAQLGLNRKSVEEEVIKIPCLEEQEKIENLFNKIDNLIELQIDKIGLLKRRKQGLLQKMFV
ncbi:restriction endonuclease subunit S [Staphylococcus hominis]|uniref:restriction endonuclease subunit S n=1 Tax=Staphylococcus hominis TaxID=1290 RepID=UPI0031BA2069